MAVSKHWCKLELIDTNKHEDLNLMFENHGEEDEIYLLTTIEIAKAQQKDQELKVYYKQNERTPKEDMHFQLIEEAKVLCKNDKLIIPASLRHRAASWYHHYLQQPSHSRLKATMRSMMYWKGMRNTIWS
jgi:general stress protein 26